MVTFSKEVSCVLMYAHFSDMHGVYGMALASVPSSERYQRVGVVHVGVQMTKEAAVEMLASLPRKMVTIV